MNNNIKISSVKHLPQLTWLRGVAALFVLFSHINRANETSYNGEIKQDFWLLNWLDLGSFGVALFFALSGCTLYLSTFERGFPNWHSLFGFYLRRFFRIWPAFAIALITYLIARTVLYDTLEPYKHTWLGAQFFKPYETTDILKYLLLIFNFTGPSGLFNNAFWSLPIEFQYYLTLPFLVIALKRFGYKALFAAIFLSHVLYKANFDHINSSLVFRLFFTFCLGVYAGFLYKHCDARLPSWVALPMLVGLSSFAFLFSNGYFSQVTMPSEWIVYGCVAVGCVIVSVLTDITLPKFLARLLNFYGDISYSLYLFHNLIIAVVVAFFVTYPDVFSPYKLVYLTVTTTLLATYVAWASYLYLELTGMKIGKLISKERYSR